MFIDFQNKIYLCTTRLKLNWVKAGSFLLKVHVNLNFPFLPNLILQLHWVKHSTILLKQDCEIELGKGGEFFTQM